MYQIIILLYLLANTAIAQSPVADLTLPASVCIEEKVVVVNNSLNSIEYEWDFNIGDLLESPNSISLATLAGTSVPTGIELVTDGTGWYGFVCSRNNNKLFRLDFGQSLDNTPVPIDLGTLNDVLDGPKNIKFINDQGNWYALVINFSGSNIVRLDFGNSLENIPTATNLGNLGLLNSPRGLELKEDDGNYIAIIANWLGNEIHLLNFGNSLLNTPSSLTFSPVGSTNLIGTSLIKSGDGNWYGIVPSFQNKLFYLDFGTNLFTIPIISDLGVIISQPVEVEIVREGSDYYAFTTTSTGNLMRISLGVDLNSPGNAILDLGNLGNLNSTFAFDMIKTGTEYKAVTMNFSSKELFLVEFPNINTQTEFLHSTDEVPNGILYQQSGSYDVNLTAFSTGGLFNSNTKTITVTTNVAPTISITSQNICLSNPINFTSSSDQALSLQTWDFGDTNTSTDPNPSHTYAAAGEYEVTLSVEDGTCSNFIKKTITIYNEPAPDFTIPTGTICTNQQASFINTTPGSYGGFISWEWQIDGLVVSTDQDLAAMFDTGGNKEVKLIATIPGCIVEMAKLLTNVKEGVLPVYSFDDNCAGQIVQFNNNSVGVVNDIAWDFGNGFTSSLENPALEFANDGTYDVTLTLTNSDGCITSTSTPITIHPLPIVNYSNELACENLATQFTDLSSITLDNLASWSWQFDDASTPSTDQNPQHIFNNFGSYNVKLTTTTTFGCVDSLVQVVEVLAAPIVDFSLDKACIDVPIQFTDQSTPVTGEGITEWSWNLGGTFSSIQNPTHIFSNALDHTVGLTVTSQNLCTSSQTKNITIPPAPTVQFELNDDCANEVATLSDNTKINGDNISQWLWKLDTQTIGIEAAIDYKFLKADNYNISLSIETENGCAYDGQQTITVHPVPTASFNTSFSFGAPPFAVAFTNESVEANEYSWFFEENELSTDVNPNHTFNNLGNFDVQLVAINDKNCRDTTFQRINVLEPILDIELLNFTIIPSANADLLSLTLRNNGTIRLDSLEVIINLGGELEVRDVINYPLNPEETVTAQLALQVKNRRLEYICASVASFIINIDDANPKNNNKCITFNSNQAIVTAPYPNPVKETLILEIVSTKNVEASVDILSTTGALASSFMAPLSEGNNKLTLDLGTLNSGIYIVKITVQDQVKTYRIMINN
jgi:PKD repeat protein